MNKICKLEINLERVLYFYIHRNCFMIKKRAESKKKKSSLNNSKNQKLGISTGNDFLFKLTGGFISTKASISGNTSNTLSKFPTKSPTATPSSKIRKQSK